MIFYPLKYFDLIIYSINFFLRNFIVLVGLCLIAAIGRIIQSGAIGEIAVVANVFLEILIQGARICIFLFVLGQDSIGKGMQRVRKTLVTSKDQHVLKSIQRTIATNFRENKTAIFINFIVFVIIAVLTNYLVAIIAYNTGLLRMLKESGVIDEKPSEWVVLLFFKNLTIIPFTIIFETIFFVWLVNKLRTGTIVNFKTSNQ